MDRLSHFDGLPVIIGAGIAGLMTALRLAPQPVVILSQGPLGKGAASGLAQGGVAASLGDDDDPALHLADTLKAGDGLCDASVAGRITQAAAETIEALARYGVRFDRGQDGRPVLGLEAAHSRRRIVHAAGDATGAEIMRALIEAVRLTPTIAVLEGVDARQLIVEDNAIAGVLCDGPKGRIALATQRLVIATGGIGGLFLETTNPVGSFGQGLALAARAGAELADLEFVQFHPTALNLASHPMALISEAVRGEGAILVDEAPPGTKGRRDRVSSVFQLPGYGWSRACLRGRTADKSLPRGRPVCDEDYQTATRGPRRKGRRRAASLCRGLGGAGTRQA